ncbi:MAG: hypothetical protein WC901_01855 [Candidatus Margulisiibacteriota bacterium]
MDYFGALNPIQSLGPELARQALQNETTGAAGKIEAQKQFVKIFVNEVLKQSLTSMASLAPAADDQSNQSIFPSFDNSVYNEMLVEAVGNELIDSGAFKIDQFIPNTQSANWREVVTRAKQSWLNP